jgi:hypothetical protein
MTRRRAGRGIDARDGALAVAIRRGEWERAALLLLTGVSVAARAMPAGTVDDVLALLSREEGADDAR